MSNRWKLLMMADSPTLNSGFSVVARNLARRWAASGKFERIDWWAIGYGGWPGAPGQVRNQWWHREPFTLYPQLAEGGWSSPENMAKFIELIVAGDYTHVWLIQDHFMLARHDFAKALRQATNRREEGPRKDVRVIYYAPVDSEIEPEWCGMAHAADELAAYTEYGAEEWVKKIGVAARAEGDGQRFGPLPRVIPHGCDTSVFRPLGWSREEREKRRIEGFGDLVKPGDCLLLNVNVNQRRKDTPRTLEILAALRAQGHRNVKLVMHMNPVDHSSDLNLEQVGRDLGLELGNSVSLFSPRQKKCGAFPGQHEMLGNAPQQSNGAATLFHPPPSVNIFFAIPSNVQKRLYTALR